jgi:hypothetical protein
MLPITKTRYSIKFSKHLPSEIVTFGGKEYTDYIHVFFHLRFLDNISNDMASNEMASSYVCMYVSNDGCVLYIWYSQHRMVG